MPKEKEKTANKLLCFARQFNDDGIEKKENRLVCTNCGIEIAMKKFQIEQHIKTTKHLKNKSAKLKQKTITSMTGEFEKKVLYQAELCQAFISANIPLFKLTNPALKIFLEKYTGQSTPDESNIRKNYFEKSYNETLDSIREVVADNTVWVSIDETMDKIGRYIANVIVGLLSENPGRPYLLKTTQLEKTNHSTIAKLFNDTMQLLWPTGIKHDKVLLFVTDAARYMLKAVSSLQALYSKMIHLTCLAHAIHRVAEVVRDTYPLVDSLISLGKQIFLKAPNRIQVFKELFPELKLPPKPVVTSWGTWLEVADYYAENFNPFKLVLAELENDSGAIKKIKDLISNHNGQLVSELAKIRSNYSFLTREIVNFEKRNVELADSLTRLREIVQRLERVPDAAVREKISKVLKNNPGLKAMKTISNFNYAAIEEDEILKELSATELSCFKFAPVISCDVERSFSAFKKILTDDRLNLTVKNLDMYLVISSYE